MCSVELRASADRRRVRGEPFTPELFAEQNDLWTTGERFTGIEQAPKYRAYAENREIRMRHAEPGHAYRAIRQGQDGACLVVRGGQIGGLCKRRPVRVHEVCQRLGATLA